jgi:cysteine desulfurase
MEYIYLDNSATTPLLPAVWEAMRPYFLDHPGNPASSHRAGRQARQALEDARERVASLLDAQPDEVIFTSGATEANNLAIFGLCGPTPGHLITSSIEHPCVIEPLRQLASRGFTLAELPVDHTGVVADGIDSLPADTKLVSVMLANHETGAVQPVEALAAAVAGRAPFHCDAAAAVGKLPVSFRRLGVTSLTVSAHKFHGPKGIGALLLKKHTRLRPLFWGGHQQHGHRPGTESVPLAVGMATALELAVCDMDATNDKVLALRASFLSRLRGEAAPVVLNGPEHGGIPQTINVSFPGCRADLLLMKLDLAGVACATGSACSSGSLLPSPVLRAMRVPEDVLRSALRFSLSPLLTAALVDEAAHRIVQTVKTLRQSRPPG